jgi:hypothetical protein
LNDIVTLNAPAFCASAPRRDPRSAPKNIKRGQPQTSQESPETTGDTFREPARQGGSRLHADPGSLLRAD